MGERELIGLGGLVVLFILLALRVPVGLAMVGVGIGGSYVLSLVVPFLRFDPYLKQFKTLLWNTVANYDLSVVPLFVLMGYLATHANLSRDLFQGVNALVGRFRGGVAMAAIAGWFALQSTPLDAIPDLSDTQVIIATEWPGRSPDLVDDQVTYPIVTALLSAPRVKYVRGQSMMGDSFVYVVFEDGTDLYWARSRVLEYLSGIQGSLPQTAKVELGPDATGVGWVYQYALRSHEHSLQELRSIQDWYLRYELSAVEGVAEVASAGGHVKQYQVTVDPKKLQAYGLTLARVRQAPHVEYSMAVPRLAAC